MMDMQKEFQLMNEVYAQVREHVNRNAWALEVRLMFQFFAADKMPARTCVGVAYLPFGAAVEIECVAEISK